MKARRHCTGWSFSIFEGWGHETAPYPSEVSARPRKEATFYEVRDRKGTYYVQVLPQRYQRMLVSRMIIYYNWYIKQFLCMYDFVG